MDGPYEKGMKGSKEGKQVGAERGVMCGKKNGGLVVQNFVP